MKQLFLSLTVLVLSFGAFAQKKADEIAKFKSETIDLGKIKQGTPTTATFVVSNIGNEPLIIEQANPTCGCTISNYTKEPIATGKTGEISATYNAAAVGTFEKHLTVRFAGVGEPKSITIKGEVVSSGETPKVKDEKAQVVNPATEVAPAKSTKATKTTTKSSPK